MPINNLLLICPYAHKTDSTWVNQPLKRWLFKKYNGICQNCSCLTKLSKKVFDDTATVEHIYQRTDMRRVFGNKVTLFCYKCNNDKNKFDVRRYNDQYSEIKDDGTYSKENPFKLINFLK